MTANGVFLEIPKNRQIVEFEGVFDYDKFVGFEMYGRKLTSDMVKKSKQRLGNNKLIYVAQFTVAKNLKTFELKYSRTKLVGPKMQKNYTRENDASYKDIVENKPDRTIWAILFQEEN